MGLYLHYYIYIYVFFLDDRLIVSLYDHLFYVFLDVTPFLYTVIIPWYLYNIKLFFTFCSRIVNIIAEIFIPTRVFVYKSWTIYKIQNVQNTKFFADYKIQNTKFIFYIDKIFFLEHLKFPLNKGYYSFFVNKWVLKQIKQ